MSDAAWRRWRMDELNGDAGRRAETERAAQLQAAFDAAREQARREGWQAGFEAGREEGLASGREEGLRNGDAESERQRRELLAPLAELAGNFSSALATVDETVADNLVELALATGRQLAGDALQQQPEQVRELVRALLREEPLHSGRTHLWLHPDDRPLVEAELAGELAAAGWELRPDPQLERGGCRVTSSAGELDASRATRWQQLLEQLAKTAGATP